MDQIRGKEWGGSTKFSGWRDVIVGVKEGHWPALPQDSSVNGSRGHLLQSGSHKLSLSWTAVTVPFKLPGQF